MTEARSSKLYFGYCEDKPVVAAFALTEKERQDAEKALRSVKAHGQIGNVASSGIVEAPRAPWMAVQADPDLTPQDTLDKLGQYGRVEYVEAVSRQDIIQTLGDTATGNLLGRRPGVL
jgi:hypothetical protein